MGSLNKVLLIGNLGKDPELRYTPDGLAILKFPMATTERFTDKSGNKAEKAVWHNIVAFDKMGQTLANYLKKGKQIFVEGRINNRSYDDKEGNKKYITEIVATNIVLLGSKGDNLQSGQEGSGHEEKLSKQHQDNKTQSGQKNQDQPAADSTWDDDIPF